MTPLSAHPWLMRTADFDYVLPPELIAQQPAATRDQSRLLVYHRANTQIEHRQFRDLIGYLQIGDTLVLNNSKVIAARLRGTRVRVPQAGQEPARFELLLLEETRVNEWWALVRPGKRARIGTEIRLGATGPVARVLDTNPEGHRLLRFSGTMDIRTELERLGEVPLPPYIVRTGAPPCNDRERYQTVYAQTEGSVAAPTAGLHFTAPLLEEIKSKGVRVAFVTLHTGFGTFAPVKTENLTEHRMHEEAFDLSAETAAACNAAHAEGRRVIAVGTTTLRVLETVARKQSGKLEPCSGRTSLFVHPPAQFQVVDALLTNFHLPRSTLLMLVSAFAAPGSTAGVERMLRTYAEAIREKYRFFSYGDAMLIL